MLKKNSPTTNAIEAEASRWLFRRDRGLTPSEQDEFLQWRQEDPRHAEAFARHEAVLGRMMRLGDWKPLLAADPNPDLFAPPQRFPSRIRRSLYAVSAVAAALALGFTVWRSAYPITVRPSESAVAYLRMNERQVLSDGSLVELKDGSRIDVAYSGTERRVKLVDGEAHFTVAKNPHRPFIVEANGVAVRAVGTMFNVRLDTDAVEVLVTEGRVQVSADPRDASTAAPTATSVSPVASIPTPQTLNAGQRTLVALTSAPMTPAVVTMTPAQVKAALSWQVPRLQFDETPLAEAIAEFNRHMAGNSSQRLVLGDPALATLPIGGTFRVDNVEGFVRLLEYTLEIHATPGPKGEVVLTRSR
jgi:transmembrane sensor